MATKKSDTESLVGQRFGRLLVLEILTERIDGRLVARCQCDCGVIKDIRVNAFKHGKTKSCGCLRKELHLKDVEKRRLKLDGKTFGNLTVLKYVSEGKWLCRCVCGNEKLYRGYSLNDGSTKSCGCTRYDASKKAISEHIKQDSVNSTRKSALTAKLHKNNKTGHKGVIYAKDRNKYRASICFQRKVISLGYYATLEEAVEARKKAEEKYFAPILEDK